MKTTKILSILFVFLAFAQFSCSQSISGNGNIQSQNRDVSGYDKIEISGGIDLVLKQGDTEGIVLKGDENLLEHIITEVKDGKLKIYHKKSFKNFDDVTAYVSVKQLNELSAAGGVNVSAQSPITANDFEYSLSGGVNMKIELNVVNLTGAQSGGVDVELKTSAKNISMNASGGCDVDLEPINADELNVVASGGVDFTVSGAVTNLKLETSGGCDVNADNLLVKNAKLELSGSCDAKVNVEEKINIDASGGCDVYLKGKAATGNISMSGGSELHRL